MKQRTREEIRQAVRTARNELDPRQLEIMGRMTVAEKIQAVSRLHANARDMAIATERHFHPELSEDEIHRRAMARVMRVSEWEPELRRKIFGF
jgi:hypothetical protein